MLFKCIKSNLKKKKFINFLCIQKINFINLQLITYFSKITFYYKQFNTPDLIVSLYKLKKYSFFLKSKLLLLNSNFCIKNKINQPNFYSKILNLL